MKLHLNLKKEMVRMNNIGNKIINTIIKENLINVEAAGDNFVLVWNERSADLIEFEIRKALGNVDEKSYFIDKLITD